MNSYIYKTLQVYKLQVSRTTYVYILRVYHNKQNTVATYAWKSQQIFPPLYFSLDKEDVREMQMWVLPDRRILNITALSDLRFRSSLSFTLFVYILGWKILARREK